MMAGGGIQLQDIGSMANARSLLLNSVLKNVIGAIRYSYQSTTVKFN
jgi:hypothetical protein